MILACGQTSPAAASNSLHFYDRVLRKNLTTTHFLGELLLRGVSGRVVFQQLRFVILPVQTKSTADCLGGGASGCICFAGSNEINRRLSERGCVSLLFFTGRNKIKRRLSKWGASACVCRRTRITPDSSNLKRNFSKIKLKISNFVANQLPSQANLVENHQISPAIFD